MTFDGAGNVGGLFNGSLNGSPGLNLPYTATYSVNPDCTGLISGIGNGDSFTFVILDDGSEIFGTDVTAPDHNKFDVQEARTSAVIETPARRTRPPATWGLKAGD